MLFLKCLAKFSSVFVTLFAIIISRCAHVESATPRKIPQLLYEYAVLINETAVTIEDTHEALEKYETFTKLVDIARGGTAFISNGPLGLTLEVNQILKMRPLIVIDGLAPEIKHLKSPDKNTHSYILLKQWRGTNNFTAHMVYIK